MANREALWDTQRLAEFLAVNRSCVERGRRRRPGQWPRTTRIGGSVGYLGGDVAAWLAGRRVNTCTGTDIPMDLSKGLIPRKELAEQIGKSIAWFERGLESYPQLLPPGYRVGVRWRSAWPEIVAWLRADRAKDPGRRGTPSVSPDGLEAPSGGALATTSSTGCPNPQGSRKSPRLAPRPRRRTAYPPETATARTPHGTRARPARHPGGRTSLLRWSNDI